MDFPSSPSVGQAYTFASRTWVWDGVGWARQINAGQIVAVFVNPGVEVYMTVESLPLTISGAWHELIYAP